MPMGVRLAGGGQAGAPRRYLIPSILLPDACDRLCNAMAPDRAEQRFATIKIPMQAIPTMMYSIGIEPAPNASITGAP
ncbi:hypothetical protein CBM2629_A50042 [Cupriavidus taiwanensis]|nr:hypothetical protein CBM2629_A50042 [Cupriavidus taiwanensis]